ncbi:MAG: hypothetical protein ABEJ98_02700 [Candidatus Nanohaloarchaea archaeon]
MTVEDMHLLSDSDRSEEELAEAASEIAQEAFSSENLHVEPEEVKNYDIVTYALEDDRPVAFIGAEVLETDDGTRFVYGDKGATLPGHQGNDYYTDGWKKALEEAETNLISMVTQSPVVYDIIDGFSTDIAPPENGREEFEEIRERTYERLGLESDSYIFNTVDLFGEGASDGLYPEGQPEGWNENPLTESDYPEEMAAVIAEVDYEV